MSVGSPVTASKFFPLCASRYYLFRTDHTLDILMMLRQMAEDAKSKQILLQLARSPYACSSLLPLSSRPGNNVYRGILVQPVTARDGDVAKTIIIKYSARSESGESLLDPAVSLPS